MNERISKEGQCQIERDIAINIKWECVAKFNRK